MDGVVAAHNGLLIPRDRVNVMEFGGEELPHSAHIVMESTVQHTALQRTHSSAVSGFQ